MLLPASVDDNVVAYHSAEHPCGQLPALRGLTHKTDLNDNLQSRRYKHRRLATRRSVASPPLNGLPLNGRLSRRTATHISFHSPDRLTRGAAA